MKTASQQLVDYAASKRPRHGVVWAASRAVTAALSLGLVLPAAVVYNLVVLPVALAHRLVAGKKPKQVGGIPKGEFPPVRSAETKTPLSEREFDVVLLGATGFAGRLAVEHLARQYGVNGEIKWAVAARRVEAAKGVLAEVGKLVGKPDVVNVTCIRADVCDEESLRAMCARTRVVATTAGPFQLYGTAVVRACIAYGCSYADITGEADWHRGLIEHYDTAAQKAGSLIVSFCGHESIPWDLTTMMCASRLPPGEALASVRCFDDIQGKPSGGTLATIVESIPDFLSPKKSKLGFDPLLKLPDGSKSDFVVKNKIRSGISMSSELGVTGPFIMSAINVEVVKRSNALNKYGKNLQYDEGRVGQSLAESVGQLLEGAIVFPFILMPSIVRDLVLPKPGEGPSRKEMEEGYLQVTNIGIGERGTRVGARIYFNVDAGYMDTARILVESALCLALSRDRLRSSGGVLTPASAMGDVLLERLVATGTKLAWLTPEEAAKLA